MGVLDLKLLVSVVFVGPISLSILPCQSRTIERRNNGYLTPHHAHPANPTPLSTGQLERDAKNNTGDDAAAFVLPSGAVLPPSPCLSTCRCLRIRPAPPAYSPSCREPEMAASHHQQGPRALPALHTLARPCRCRCRARCSCWRLGKWSLAPPQDHGQKCGYGPACRRPLHHLGRFLGRLIALRDGYVRFTVCLSTNVLGFLFYFVSLPPLNTPARRVHIRASSSPSLHSHTLSSHLTSHNIQTHRPRSSCGALASVHWQAMVSSFAHRRRLGVRPRNQRHHHGHGRLLSQRPLFVLLAQHAHTKVVLVHGGVDWCEFDYYWVVGLEGGGKF